MPVRPFICACLLLLSAWARLPAANPVFEPAITGEIQPPQYILWDAGSGPNPTCSNQQLGIRWVHPTTGDYVDASDVAQGSTPFGAVLTPTAGAYYEVNAAALVTRALANGNKGFYLTPGGGSAVNSVALICSGRLGMHPPVLVVTTSTGTFTCACLQSAAWSSSSYSAFDSRTRFTIDGSSNFAVVRFDLSAVTGTVSAATLSLYVENRFGSGTTLQLFEADPPRFVLGAGAATPTLGLAAEVGEAQLATHPDVYMAGDFTGTTFSGDYAMIPKLFGNTQAPANNAPQVIADTDAPGTVAWRGSFTAGVGDSRQSFNGTKLLMVADTSDPLRPPLNLVDEVYYRLYFYLENDWNSERDGNKMAITWDLRMGWWNDAGYWQSVSGNGGAPGYGRRNVQAVAAAGGAMRYVYDGHMERMESGFQPNDGSPYKELRPFVGYNYHIDQGTAFPSGFVYNNLAEVKFTKGHWVCVEQRLKMNSIDLSHPDAQGNGVANYDGILETWVDGVKIDGRYNYRWRAHPQMGVAAVNSNWFFGGTQPTEVTQHYRLNHLVVAKRYIGPRVQAPLNPVPEIVVSRGGAIADGGIDAVSGTAAGAGTTLTYTIANTGGAVLSLGATGAITGTNCTVVVTTAPAPDVAAGSSTTLVLTVTPTASGAWSFPLSFATNDPDENPTNWTVSSATPPAPEIVVTRGGVIIDGGTDTVAATAPGAGTALTYTIANSGGAALTVGAIGPISGSNCAAVVTTAPASTVAAGASTTLVLTVTPTASGAWSFPLSFATNDTNENPTNWTVSGTAAIGGASGGSPSTDGGGRCGFGGAFVLVLGMMLALHQRWRLVTPDR